MRNQVAWLYAQLPELVERGVLSADAADALHRHYGPSGPDGSRTGWGQALLASFGALLVGGGLILILAHNWDGLARAARAAIAMGVLATAQILTIFAVLRRAGSVPWREASSGLLVAAVGAAIALVGQTYHVGGSFEGLMIAWLWLVVLIPYLTGSTLAAIGFWALLVVRVANLAWRDAPFDPWLLALVAFPFVVLHERRRPASWGTALLIVAAAASVFVVGTILSLAAGWTGLWAVFQVSVLAAVIAVASWPPSTRSNEAWRTRVLVPAWLALVVIATILSFDDPWRQVTIGEEARRLTTLSVAIVSIGCVVLASALAVRLARAAELAASAGAGAAVLVLAMHLLAMTRLHALGFIAFNLWLLAIGILSLIQGGRRGELGTANRGLLALGALMTARFFDTDLSFLARGLVFMVFGAGCFALNLWMMRRTRKATP